MGIADIRVSECGMAGGSTAGFGHGACSKTIYNFDSIRNFGAFAA
jgi:hypothetical protein